MKVLFLDIDGVLNKTLRVTGAGDWLVLVPRAHNNGGPPTGGEITDFPTEPQPHGV